MEFEAEIGYTRVSEVTEDTAVSDDKTSCIAKNISDKMTGMGKWSGVDYYTADLRFDDLIVSVSMPKSEVLVNGFEGVEAIVTNRLAAWVIDMAQETEAAHE